MGQGTTEFLASFDTAIPPLEPNLVVIQLGGNDKGSGDGLDHLPTYRANLACCSAKSSRSERSQRHCRREARAVPGCRTPPPP